MSKAARSRQAALDEIQETYRKQYKRIVDYCLELLWVNPGSTLKLKGLITLILDCIMGLEHQFWKEQPPPYYNEQNPPQYAYPNQGDGGFHFDYTPPPPYTYNPYPNITLNHYIFKYHTTTTIHLLTYHLKTPTNMSHLLHIQPFSQPMNLLSYLIMEFPNPCPKKIKTFKPFSNSKKDFEGHKGNSWLP
ncbi:hypothetical protein Ahy_B03g064750 [Arachis hypogaea]|uniref:Uncharacterized protein n=1 Tax=Arachis hypogaea TaxID=3818 RepID=A0A445A0C6_ARAHY|nr:hypothetical protein Ahy_B03g064750 [Arachis hypogaea]